MKQTFTSASASKQIRVYEEEKMHLLQEEKQVCTFELSSDEEFEAPEYDYEGVRARVAELDDKVRVLRCALHAFNVATVLPESNISIDEALVLLAQLSNERFRLSSLRSTLPKQRVSARYQQGTKVVEYCYANFDVKKAEADYQAVSERIRNLQMEIDYANQTVQFDVDL